MSKSTLLSEAFAAAEEFKKLAIEKARLDMADSVTPAIKAILEAQLLEDFTEDDEESQDEAASKLKKATEPETEEPSENKNDAEGHNDLNTDESFDSLMEKMKKLDPEKAKKIEDAVGCHKEDEEGFDIDKALKEIEGSQGSDDDKTPPVTTEPDGDEDNEELDEDLINQIIAEMDGENDEPEEKQDEASKKKIDFAPAKDIEGKERKNHNDAEGKNDLAEAEESKKFFDKLIDKAKSVLPSDALAKLKKIWDEEISPKSVQPGGNHEFDADVLPGNVNVREDEEEDKVTEQLLELRDKLKGINLLNSKLLYQNKIFASGNLSEAQIAKVLKAFDKAKTTAETK